jgi:TonB family protein
VVCQYPALVRHAALLLSLAGLIALPTRAVSSQVVAGRLVDRETRGAIEGAAVSLTDSANVLIAQTVSDTSGEFMFTLARPGRYKLSFSAGNVTLGDSQLIDVGASDFYQRIYILQVPREEPVYFEFQVAKQVAPRPGNPPPRYPPELRARGIQGDVLVQFVVDSAGKPEPGTLRVLRSTDPEFAHEVARVVRLMRFFPAQLADGKRVRQLVRMPFQFMLTF